MVKGNIKRICIAAFCVYMIAVAVLCFIRPSSLPEVDIKSFLGIPIDKLLHFLMFLPYPFLSGMSFMSRKMSIIANMLTLIILTVAGIGIAYGTELIQAQTDYRSYEIADFKADAIGIAIGTICTFIGMSYIKLKK